MADWRKVGASVALVVAMSPAGYQMLKSHEGLGQPGAQVQQAYADPYYGWKLATICYGHTASVKRGDTATMAQCEAYLREDVDQHCALVYDALMPLGVWLTQGEQDAYCSLAYNLGKFKGTDSVYGRLLKHDDWGACMGLLKYYYSNGQPSRGLWNRRYVEYNLCISQLEVKRYGPR
jgi:lysozyme